MFKSKDFSILLSVSVHTSWTFKFFSSYLNTTFIKKQKYSDADLNYGGFTVELTDQMLEIGEVGIEVLFQCYKYLYSSFKSA